VNSLYASPGIQPSIYKKYLRDPEILQKNTEVFKTGEGVQNVCTALLYWPDIHAGSSNKQVGGRFGVHKTNCASAAGRLHPTVQNITSNIKFWNR